MVDITIDADATGLLRLQGSQIGPVDAGANRYVFYTSVPGNIVYRKSDDKGLTYGPEVTIYDGTTATIAVVKFAVWFDQWTFGDTGTLIHIGWLGRGAGGNVKDYRSLDTADDTLSAIVSVVSFGVVTGSQTGWIGASRATLGLVKSRAGRLHYFGWLDNGAGDKFHSVSLDGITWDDTKAVIADEGAGGVKLLAVPGNGVGAEADIWAVFNNGSDVRVKVYDNAGDAWGASVAVTAITSAADGFFQMSICERFSDHHYILTFWNQFDAPTADLEVWELVTQSSFIQLTNVNTNADGTFECPVFIDQATDTLYVGWLGGTPLVSVDVLRGISTDGGVTWNNLQYSVTADDHRVLRMPPMAGNDGGRFMMIWRNDDLDDIVTNADNAVEVAGTPTEPPPGPPPIVPPGGTYGPAAGAVPGSISYITPAPESREYPLVTPHVTGRFVMSESGMGTPDIQYITQRGPSQDGESLRDFNLRPRVVQLLERQQFKGRDAWWTGRADMLNELRPNRQSTATGVATGILRHVKANGDVRDLNVLIESGPRFEARNVNEWDEWATEEVLRFIAFDPLFFDPARVDLTLAFTLDANLVFPIDFPIQFGSGLVDVSGNLDYTGTWASLPTIVIVGPFDHPIIDNVTTGEKIDLNTIIAAGRTVTIDLAFGQKTITDDLGTNLLGSLTTDSDLGTFHIAPTPEAPQVVGQPRPTARNVIRLRGSNPTGLSSVQVRYFTRYFGI